MAVSTIMTDISDLDNSPHAQMARRLDELMDQIHRDKMNGELRAEARGVAFAITVLLCCSMDEVREAAQIRYEERQTCSKS